MWICKCKETIQNNVLSVLLSRKFNIKTLSYWVNISAYHFLDLGIAAEFDQSVSEIMSSTDSANKGPVIINVIMMSITLNNSVYTSTTFC